MSTKKNANAKKPTARKASQPRAATRAVEPAELAVEQTADLAVESPTVANVEPATAPSEPAPEGRTTEDLTPPTPEQIDPIEETPAPTSEPVEERPVEIHAQPAVVPPKRSALDAAAQVLAEAHKSMNCAEMVGLMAIKGYWVSPGGKTPAATLYSAILREISTRGERSRFRKIGPGRFARTDLQN